MIESFVEILGVILGFYLAVGMVVAWRYTGAWAREIDPAAAHGNRWFQLVIFPAATALWPWLIGRLRSPQFDFNPSLPESVQSTVRRANGPIFAWLMILLLPLGLVALVGRSKFWTDGPMSPVSFVPAINGTELVRTECRAFGQKCTLILRDTPQGGRQLQYNVPGVLSEPTVAVYWRDGKSEENLPSDAVFLGMIWGPHEFLFKLPSQTSSTVGTVYTLALASANDTPSVTTLEIH